MNDAVSEITTPSVYGDISSGPSSLSGASSPLFVSNDPIVGRQDEQDLLLQSYQRVTMDEGASEVILIHGSSGTGKTVLAQSLRELLSDDSETSEHVSTEALSSEGCEGCEGSSTRETLMQRDLCFVEGKFDQLIQSNPYYAISIALSDLVERMVHDAAVDVHHIKETLSSKLAPEEFLMLSSLIPNTDLLVGVTASPMNVQPYHANQYTFSNLKKLCKFFLQTVVSKSYPVILFLDDIQWASVEAIDIIQSIAFDKSIHGLLLIASYRQEEAGVTASPLSAFLASFQSSDETPRVTDIELGNLNVEDMNQLVHLMTGVAKDVDTRPLNEVVLTKTHGNPFHTVQYFRMLLENGMLVMDNTKRQVSWDLNQIQAETNVSSNVIAIMCSRIERLDPDTQHMLQLAACLGFRFDAQILTRIAVTEPSITTSERPSKDGVESSEQLLDQCALKLKTALKVARKQHLVENADRTKGKGVVVKFSHDRVRESLLSLIPDEEKLLIHLRIGKCLNGLYEQSESVDSLLFLAVSQYNRAADIIDDQIYLCRLNRTAGQRALANCSFNQAASYLRNSVNLVRDAGLWKDHYYLALDVCSLSAEYESYAGRFKQSGRMIDYVLEQARSPDDRLRVLYTRIESLSNQGEIDESINLAVDVLNTLGQNIRRVPRKSGIIKEIISVSWKVRGMDDAALLALDSMRDKKVLGVMRLFRLLFALTFLTLEKELLILLCLRAMSLTLSYGLCGASATAIAAHALVLMSLGNFDVSHRFAKLSLVVLDRHGDRNNDAMTLFMVSSFIFNWFQPMRSLVPHFDRAMDSATASGEPWAAIGLWYGKIQLQFVSGTPLDHIELDAMALLKVLNDGSNRDMMLVMLPLLQTLANLRIHGQDPTMLNGKFMKEQEFKAGCLEKKNELALMAMIGCKMLLAVLFEEWSVVIDVFKPIKKQMKESESHFGSLSTMTYLGIAYAKMAQSSKLRVFHLSKARKILRFLKTNGKQGSEDVVAHGKLLEAELTCCKTKSVDRIRNAFDAAAAAFHEVQYVHTEAFACERAGKILLELSETAAARSYLERARDLYIEWNAPCKVEHIQLTLDAT